MEYCKLCEKHISDFQTHIINNHLNEGQKNLAMKIIDYIENDSDNIIKGIRVNSAGGTGKTFVVSNILSKYPDVIYLTPTHCTKDVLIQTLPKKLKEDVHTIHHYIGWKKVIDEFGKEVSIWENKKIDPKTIFVFDEISMYDSFVSSLFKEFFYGKNKVILLGDKAQLPPIENKKDKVVLPENVKLIINNDKTLSYMFQFKCLDIYLTENVRAKQRKLLEYINNQRECVLSNNKEVILKKNYTFDINWFKENKFKDYVIICWRNDTKNYYNNLLHDYFSTDDKEYCIGDKIIIEEYIPRNITRSDPISNGSRFTILDVDLKEIIVNIKDKEYILEQYSIHIEGCIIHRISDNSLSTFLDYIETLKSNVDIEFPIEKKPCANDCSKKHKCKKKTPGTIIEERRYIFKKIQNEYLKLHNKFSFVFATTCHKAQGSSCDNIFINISDFESYHFKSNDKLKYTAISRTKKQLYMFEDKTIIKKK